MSDLPAKLEKRPFDADDLDGLVLEAVDERTLREDRERRVARARLLWGNRRFLGRALIAGLVAGLLFAFLLPSRYEATARLMPPDQGMGGNMFAALANRVGEGVTDAAESALGLQMKTTSDLFVGILKSQAVEDDLIHKFDLQKLYHARYIEDARDALTRHTSVSVDQKSGIIQVTVTDHNPKRAAAMAQEYVDKLNWVVTYLSTSSAHRERIFLDQRLLEVKGDLEAAEKDFSRFASDKGAIDVPTQGRAILQSAATLQGQLIVAQSELQGLREIYTDNNSRVRSLQARVNELQAALQRIGGAGANEKSSAQDLYPSIRQLPVLGVTYADLLRRSRVEEVVFETLTQQDELAKVEEAKEIPSVKLLDPPAMPQKKSFPPSLSIMMTVGGLVALAFGCLWILTKSAWETIEPGDPRKSLAIEVWSDVRHGLPRVSRNGTQGTARAEEKSTH